MAASTRASASSWVSPAALSGLADTTRECCRQVRPGGCWTRCRARRLRRRVPRLGPLQRSRSILLSGADGRLSADHRLDRHQHRGSMIGAVACPAYEGQSVSHRARVRAYQPECCMDAARNEKNGSPPNCNPTVDSHWSFSIDRPVRTNSAVVCTKPPPVRPERSCRESDT